MEPAAHSFTNSLYMIYVGEAHFSRSPYLVARLWIIAIIIIILCADILSRHITFSTRRIHQPYQQK